MKPFDLKAAKRGEPVCTRGGRKVHLYTTEACNKNFPIVGCVEERPGQFTSAHEWFADGRKDRYGEHRWDLFMAPKMRKVRVVVWIDRDGVERAKTIIQTDLSPHPSGHKIFEVELEEP